MFLDLYMKSIKRIEKSEFIPRNLISSHPVRAPKFIQLILEQTQKLEILEKLKLLDDKADKDIKNQIQQNMLGILNLLIKWSYQYFYQQKKMRLYMLSNIFGRYIQTKTIY